MRALTILDALVSNAGKSFQRDFGDDMLLERLRTMATDPMTDRDIKTKLAGMFIEWNHEFKDVPAMNRVAHLKDSLPRRKERQAPVVRPPTPDSDSEDERPQGSRGHSRNASASGPSTPKRPPRPSHDSPTSRYTYVEPSSPPKEKSSFFGSSKKSKKSNKPTKISLEAEKPKILQTIAAANQASTNLQNALKHVNKEDSGFLSDPNIVKTHQTCRDVRKAILHYIAGIESEEWVGTLLQTNDNLVAALQLYEEYNQIATARDSDDVEHRDRAHRNMTSVSGLVDPPAKPTRPARPAQVQASESESESEDEESIVSEGDEDDPFGNQHFNSALKTPGLEKPEPQW